MMDNTISLKAKGIYAYLCSYAGSNMVAYPSTKRITSEMDISVNSLHKYINELINAGYIIKQAKAFRRTLYTIVAQDGCSYGVIEKALMTDDNININSKALYAYISAFAGIYGHCKLSTSIILHHLNISSTTFQIAVKHLNHYISINKNRQKGKFADTQYVILSRSDTQIQPQPKICDTQDYENQENEKQDLPQPKICDTYNNSYINNNSIYQSSTKNQKITANEIKEHLNIADGEIENIIVDVIVSTNNSNSQTIRVSKQEMTKSDVVAQLKKLTAAHIKYVINILASIKTKIYNIKAYILTLLFNAPMQYSLNVKKEEEHKPSYDLEAYERNYDVFNVSI